MSEEKMVMTFGEDKCISHLIETLYGEQCTSDDTYFAYDFGDGELIDEEGLEFFYHLEYGYDDDDTLYLTLQRWYENCVETCEISESEKGELTDKVKQLMDKYDFKLYTYEELDKIEKESKDKPKGMER